MQWKEALLVLFFSSKEEMKMRKYKWNQIYPVKILHFTCIWLKIYFCLWNIWKDGDL